MTLRKSKTHIANVQMQATEIERKRERARERYKHQVWQFCCWWQISFISTTIFDAEIVSSLSVPSVDLHTIRIAYTSSTLFPRPLLISLHQRMIYMSSFGPSSSSLTETVCLHLARCTKFDVSKSTLKNDTTLFSTNKQLVSAGNGEILRQP